MASQDILKEMNSKLYEYFKTQAIENGYFDVCFKIGEEKLYAHKVILAAVSKPFNAMFADRWTNTDEPIELKEYSFDDYKEFMTFIYSGKCELNNDNVLSLVDMSECYDIASLKRFCDAYLAQRCFDDENMFQYISIARKYSLIQFDEALRIYISANHSALLGSDKFMDSTKAVVEAFVDYTGELGEEENEYCFNRVLEWAQKQVEAKMNASNDENFDLQKAIKDELTGIAMRFKFAKMSTQFLLEHVAKHSYLFSGDELSKLLLSSRKIVVTVTNFRGNTVVGKIPYNQEMFDTLISLNNNRSDSTYYASNDGWCKEKRIPSTPSSLKKNDSIPFYLVIRDRHVYLFSPRFLKDTDYLIAKMKGDNEFTISGQCYMNVYSNLAWPFLRTDFWGYDIWE